MQTLTKLPLQRIEIDAIIQHAFSATVTTAEEINDGMFNAAYRIEMDRHNPVFLKVAPSSDIEVMTYEENILQTEAKMLELAVRAPGLPVPELLYADFTHLVINRDYVITNFIPSVAWNHLSEEIRKTNHESLQRALGQFLGNFHKIKGSRYGYFSIAETPKGSAWDTAFLLMLEHVLKDGEAKNVELPWDYDQIREAFAANRSFLQEVTEPSLVHFDLWANNVRVRKSELGYDLVGIVDFERGFWGDPYADFVCNFQLFWPVEKHPAFIEAYNQASGQMLEFNESTRRRMTMYRAYLFLIMIVEMPYRKYSPEHRKFLPMIVKDLSDCLKRIPV